MEDNKQKPERHLKLIPPEVCGAIAIQRALDLQQALYRATLPENVILLPRKPDLPPEAA